jgi:hypothetical protein
MHELLTLEIHCDANNMIKSSRMNNISQQNSRLLATTEKNAHHAVADCII